MGNIFFPMYRLVMDQKKIFTLLGQTAAQADVSLFLVGGVVRDRLLGKDTHTDFDFMVEGSGLAFGRVFAEAMGEERGRLVEFPDFDTARFLFLERTEEEAKVLYEVEFAGARSESYEKDSRKPIVKQATIEEDLSRRDFTVNAMAQQLLPDGQLGDIVDPFEGQKDLEAKILRTPLDPEATFEDDPLRMLRACRFAAQLNFSIEKSALEAIYTKRKRLSIISQERIQEEIMKLMKADVPSIGWYLLYQTKLIDEFLPEVNLLAGVEEVKGYSHKDNLSHTFAVVDNLATRSPKPLLRFAALMHDIAKPQTKKFIKGRGWTFDMHEHLGRKMTKDIMRRLRFSSKDVRYVSELVRWHLQPIALMDKGVTDSAVRRLMVNLEEKLDDLLLLCRADITTGNQRKKAKRLRNYDVLEERLQAVREIDALRAFHSPFRGEEIMALTGLKGGPTVGKMKKAIEEAILDGKIPNEHDAAEAYAKEIAEEYVKDAEDWERGKC